MRVKNNITAMKKKKQTQVWPQGTTEFEVTLPATATKSGKDEKVKLSFSKSLVATKPLTDKGWIEWEIDQSKIHLEKSSYALEAGKPLTTLYLDDLWDSLKHAVSAWCQAHLLTKYNSSNENNSNAFFQNCPEGLKKVILKSLSALQRIKFGTVSPIEAHAAVSAATEALIKATRRRSRSTHRAPAHRKSNRRK